MRFSPTRLLQGLRFTAPVLLLTLAACGGGGGGGSSTPAPTYSLGGAVSNASGSSVVLLNNGGDITTVPSGATSYAFATKLAAGASYNITVQSPSSYICSVANATGTMTSAGVANADVTCLPSFTLGGTVTNLLGSGLKLRNNGGDDLSVTGSPYVFATQVAGGQPYDITVLSQPTSPNQICDFTGSPMPPSGTMPSSSITNANITCSSAYTIGGISGTGGVTGLAGNLILQNNAGDNLAVAGNGTADFTFSTLLLNSAGYSVSILKGPYAQDCVLDSSASGSVASADVTNVLIACTPNAATIPALDHYAYTANILGNTITYFDINSDGSLTSNGTFTGFNNPSSIAVKKVGANNYAYVTNYSSGATGYVAVYKVNLGNLDVVQASIAAGKGPYAIAIHPSGYYAYVINRVDNTVSAYSIDASTGALARIDTDGSTAATQYSITTGTSSSPIAIAIHPGGGYVYVVNSSSNNIRGYSIDAHTGALTPTSTPTFATGSAPYSIAIDPTGRYAYVANSGTASNSISAYSINTSTGVLTRINADNGGNQDLAVGTAPKAVTIHPSGKFAYVVNSSSKTVVAYKINSGGGLSMIGTALSTGTSNPVSITIDRSGTYAYVINYYDTTNNTLAFSIDSTTGALTYIGTVNGGSNPNSIATSP